MSAKSTPPQVKPGGSRRFPPSVDSLAVASDANNTVSRGVHVFFKEPVNNGQLQLVS